MNIYILVEGKTEILIYPEWIKIIMPNLTRVDAAHEVMGNNYYIFGDMGFPCILDDLENVVEDKEIIDKYDYLIVSLDSDDETPEVRRQKVIDICKRHKFDLQKLKIIIQKPCFETWCLGNRTIFSRFPDSERLRACIAHFNVSEQDPEEMIAPDEYRGTIGDYHEYYLRQIFVERKSSYSKGKRRVIEQLNEGYFDQILRRYNETGHLKSFNEFYEAFNSIQKVLV
ncbi:hypothetical protein QC477_005878 [Bacillus cereus]|uniref:hypothetical protein n=1 Tax=Bacillus cereus group TaxID=86661 RepID=UPI00097779A1|nr:MULTISPECIES: hypothetical protein [Bacillus cereus group]EKS8379535.1 hypothetical protein [Bacillus cereus]EKS8385378.1 hypothetical protein [Bacillus cereus]EMA7399724.1 hypothetical protein [Bacillus cereus]EMA7401309.1 hypothetical protein [Bacillus cereus]OMH25020.1 hypothetical protein BUM91_28325 [Bacillus thuringiensis]